MQRSMDPSNPSDSSLPALPDSEDGVLNRPPGFQSVMNYAPTGCRWGSRPRLVGRDEKD